MHILEPYFVTIETCLFQKEPKYAAEYDVHHLEKALDQWENRSWPKGTCTSKILGKKLKQSANLFIHWFHPLSSAKDPYYSFNAQV